MRRPVALLCAALLGACSVEVDGAPCTVPGATADCPGGQACGNDRRCSARALACAASRCTPGEGDVCLDPAGAASGIALARWCEASDPVCGSWTVDRCADRGFACGRRSGAARCECPPAATRDLVVRADGAPRAALPFATGAAAPPGCAFATLEDALAVSRDLRDADPTATVTVTATGAPSGGTATFHLTESIFVRNGVTLRADPAGGGTYLIALDHSNATVTLREGAALRGFTVRPSAGAPAGIELIAVLPPHPVMRLSDVTLVGPGAASGQDAIGIDVSGAAILEDVVVRDVPGAGIRVWPGDPSFLITIARGSVTGNGGAGIVANAGRVHLDGVRVAENVGRGVEVAAGVAAEIRGARIVRNGDTGLALSGASAIRVTGNTVWGNRATTAWGGSATPSGLARRAGGVVLSGTPPAAGAFELWGNRIYGNGGDQLLLLGPPAATWSLDQPATCTGADGPVTNMIGCYDPEPAGTTGASRGIVAIDTNASALNQWWGPSGASASDATRLPSGTIPVSTTCQWTTPGLACDSEDPPP